MALLEYVRGESKAMRGDRRTSGCVVGVVVGGGIAGRVVTEGVVCGVGNGIGVLLRVCRRCILGAVLAIVGAVGLVEVSPFVVRGCACHGSVVVWSTSSMAACRASRV